MIFCKPRSLGLALLLTGFSISKLAAQIADPVLGVTGVNNSAQTVTVSISDSTAGAVIYYTTNGQTPTTSSSTITSGGTLNLSQSSTLEVLVFSGSETSDLVTAQYTDLGLISSSANGDHTVVINKDGTISAMGNGTSGQLGGGNASSSNLPAKILSAGSTSFTGAYPARGLVSTTQAMPSLPVTSGLTAWFKADTGVVTSSGSVTQWNDQTSNHYNVAPTAGYAPTTGVDPGTGKSVVNFNGNQLLYTTAQVTGLDNVTIITVAASANPSSGNQTQVLVGDIFNSNGARIFSYNNGNVAFGNTNTTVTGGPAPANSFLNINSVTFSEPTGSQTSGTATFYTQGSPNGTPQSISATTLANGLMIGSVNTPPFLAWNGSMAEIIIYNRVLSPTDRQSVELYLANKYGLYVPGASWINSYSASVQAEINRNLWNRNQADAYVAFQNANEGMLTNGLRLWLRADAGVTTGIGSYVTGWADQTGNYPLSPNPQSPFYSQPLLVKNDSNGEPALRFSGSQSLTSSLGIGLNADMTIITVGMTTAPSVFQYSLCLGIGTTGTARAMGYNNAEEFFDTSGGSGSTASGGAAPTQNFFVIEAASLNSTLNTVTFYRNGTQTGSGTLSGVLAPSSGIAVGTSYRGDYWQGDISEVLVYDHQLSSAQLQQVNLYLANKYGLYYAGASWISNYSSAVQTQINANQWNEVQANQYVQVSQILPVANGLTAWFKADSSVITNSAGQVTAWKDSSWNQNEISQTTLSNCPTTGTDPGTGTQTVTFSTGQTLGNDNSYPSVRDNTIIMMASTPNPAALSETPVVTYGNPVNDGNVSGLAYDSQGTRLNGVTTFTPREAWETIPGFSLVDGGNLPETSVLTSTALSYSSSAGTVSFYCNGTGNDTFSASAGSFNNGLSLGSSNWLGNISEVLVYNRALSSTEIGEIQTYFAAKYPSGAAPSISVSGTNASTSRTVTLSGATSPAVIYYTLNGSVPTSNSTQYTGPFTLTQDGEVVKCAIFNSGAQTSQLAIDQVWVGDTYGIGIADAWQAEYLGSITDLNPNALVPGLNGVTSGLTYLQAFQWGYNPLMFSTNGDGLSDLVNHELGYAGNDTDINGYTDGSGNPMTNAQQLALGLDPFDAGVNPAQPAPPATNPSDHTPPPINLTQPNNATLLP